MTQQTPHRKVTTDHLQRDAYLYVRQSSLKQVQHNTASTERQYALRQRAVNLGWPIERIHVIDHDQGQSGASADREGFQRLVADVGMGRAGIVMGLEVSRLVRNCAEWYRLLEICALTDTLILDEEGIYNPQDFNDRMLLGLKGTLSEAELHAIHARLQGGKLKRAQTGELRTRLPTGFVYTATGQVVRDPDQQVRQTFELMCKTFRRITSAHGLVKTFRQQDIKLPRRIRSGDHKGELLWADAEESRVRSILRNPRFAGAYFYGRTKTRKTVDGHYKTQKLSRNQWYAFIKDAHEGYISWEDYEHNLQILRENSSAHGKERRKSPPREGPALLQGLVICGVCGRRMTVRYHSRKRGLVPNYVCQKAAVTKAEKVCQDIAGGGIDAMIGELILESMNPIALEVAFRVQQEIQSQLDETDRLRRQCVERARYEVDLARRRYMQVDPNNRLVADVLEAEWNAKLRELSIAQNEYERQRAADQLELDGQGQEQIVSLAKDFPSVWKNPKTPCRERKRMVRLLIEDVTLIKTGKTISAHIRFKGGARKRVELRVPKIVWELSQHAPEVVAEVDRLLDEYTDGQIAKLLPTRCPQARKSYTRNNMYRLRKSYGLKSRYDRLRDAGMLTQKEMSELLGVCEMTVRIWRNQGFLKAHRYNDKPEYLYEHPGKTLPEKMQGVKFSVRGRCSG
ncbi:MAG: recombinase family protein [bacterium]|nr:recombinase family protein [bacterium]